MNQSELEQALKALCAPGAKCGNCGATFGDACKPKSLVTLRNISPGDGPVFSTYAICGTCHTNLLRFGTRGIPNARQDAKAVAAKGRGQT
ncbi:MAG: hypothetical protein KGL39_53600 [Patescibacteria group bacterium]|nr:hypothetical protein [Patescibacteria group bacterium]